MKEEMINYLKTHAEQHDCRYFAMLNNAVAISDNDRYEGGKPEKALAYYQYLLQLDIPDCPVKFDLNDTEFKSIEKGLTDLQNILRFLQNKFANKSIFTPQSMNALLEMIKKNSQETGVCYLPSGYSNIKGGHFAGLKLRKLENGHFAFSIINQGGGMQYHRLLSATEFKNKRSYQSEEYEIDIDSENGRELIKKLLELQYNLQEQLDTKKIIKPYSEHDQYGLLQLYGKKLPAAEKLNEKNVTSQRSGSCTVTNINGIMRDISVDNNINLKRRKKNHFVLKLRSLIVEYYHYMHHNFPGHLLEWSLREFAVRINKQYKTILTDEEVIYCGQLQAEITARIEKDKNAEIAKKCERKPFPAILGDAPKNSENLFEKLQDSKYESDTSQILPEEDAPEVKKTKPQIAPENIIGLIKKIKTKTLGEFFEEVYQLFMTLPPCSGELKDKFWDRVPENQLEDLIYAINSAVTSYCDYSETATAKKKSEQLTISLIAYDIAAQIAPRIPDTKLGDFYSLGLDNIIADQTFLENPRDYYTAKRILNNFGKRARNKTRVLTNAVNYDDNKQDNTIHYIMHEILNYNQRQFLMSEINKRKNQNKSTYTDSELFDFLMQNVGIRCLDNNKLKLLIPETVQYLIGIAAKAHRLGRYNISYIKNENNEEVRCFTKNQFHHELKRQKELKKFEIHKSLPAPKTIFEYQDFSENTLYHPRDNLEKFRKQYKSFYGYSPEVQSQPYQFYPSGSLSPDSQFWKFEENQTYLFEQLDEELRHIACSPNLQVVRALAYAKNNLEKLSKNEVRTKINELIFQYGKLDQALAYNSDSTIPLMQKFFQAIFAYCQKEGNQEIELLLWAAELSDKLRYFVEVSSGLYQFSIMQYDWPSCRKILLKKVENIQDSKIRSKLASQFICSYEHVDPHELSIEECYQLLIMRMIANMQESAYKSDKVWEKISPKIQEVLYAEKNIASEKINKLFSQYFKNILVPKWAISKTKCQSGDSGFIIDLKTGELHRADETSLKDRTEDTLLDNQELFAKLKLTCQNIRLCYSENQNQPRIFLTTAATNTAYLPSSTSSASHQSSASEYQNTSVIFSLDMKWEFVYEKTNDTSGIHFKIKKVYHYIPIEEKKSKFELVTVDNKASVDLKNNLFENPAFMGMNGSHFQYWRSLDDVNTYFVYDEKNHIAYLYSLQKSRIVQLILNERQEWQRNDKILLNLVKPKTKLEQAWSERLGPKFGEGNLHCIAELSKDKTQCQLQSIAHHVLNLNFTINTKQQLECKKIPGYVLSTQQSLMQAQGLSTLVILEKKDNPEHKKYIIPAFALQPGGDNNEFDYENFINHDAICYPKHSYYSYVLNKEDELEGNSVEANLYLSILYRSQGEYQKAMKALSRCNNYKNISAHTVEVAMQVLKRKMKSPMAAAFDLKLSAFLNFHQKKWSDDKDKYFEPVKISKDWKKWIDKQFTVYCNAQSGFKSQITFIPEYCRLSSKELEIEINVLDTGRKAENLDITVGKLNERIQKISRFPKDLFYRSQDWSEFVGRLKTEYMQSKDNTRGLTREYSSLRLFADGANPKPSLNYIITYFSELFNEALSQDAEKNKKLRITLFSLLQNEKEPNQVLFNLISILLFSCAYPHYFSKLTLPQDTFEAIEKVGEILNNHIDELKDKKIYLIEDVTKNSWLLPEKSIDKDYPDSKATFKIGEIKLENDYKTPLILLRKKYFQREDKPIAGHPFRLNIAELPNATLLEKKLFEHFKTGHEANQEKLKPEYTWNQGLKLTDLKLELITLQDEDRKIAKKLKSKLLIKANKTPIDSDKAKATNLLMARASEQKPVITFGDILSAFLNQDVTLLTNRNPYLTQADVEKIFANIADYLLVHSRIDQIDDVLNTIGDKNEFGDKENYELQLIATLLDKERAYDIHVYPEFLVYEYAMKKIIRHNQKDVICQIVDVIEGRKKDENIWSIYHALQQFDAGGGKSSLIIIILALLFSKKIPSGDSSKFLPVIFNTNELYDIGLHEIPKNLRAAFMKNIEVVERELEHAWTADELNKLYKDLVRWKQEGKILYLKPVTWHSINIAMKMAAVEPEKFGDLYHAAKQVLGYFKNYCVKIEDEPQIISDPLQQSIKTSGKDQQLPDDQLQLLLRFYDYLMGYEKDSREIVALAGIKDKVKHSVSASDLKQLQEKLAEKIIHDPCFADINNFSLLQKYITQEGCERPEWLIYLHKSNQKLADLVVLSRAFIKTHLPHILNLQYEKDYGYSIHEHDLTVAPKHDGSDVTSHFGDHTLVAALCNQLYEQEGVPSAQVEALLNRILALHHEERHWNTDLTQPTEAEKWLLQVIPSKYMLKNYQGLTREVCAALSNESEFLKNPIVIKKYLREFVFPQIKVPEMRYTSTPAEFQRGFVYSVMLSATPGLPEIYPVYLKKENCFLKSDFEAQVIDTLLSAKNSGLALLTDIQTPKDFFDQIGNDLLKKMTTLIDRGGILTDFDGEKIAEAYLDISKDIIPTQTTAFFESKDLHLKSKDPNIKNEIIFGSSLVEALKAQNQKPEEFLLFLFLKLSKTTGTDIKRTSRDHAGLTVGKLQTLTDQTIQAGMRLRQLNEKDAQSMTWIMFESLYLAIYPHSKPGTFDPAHIFYWMIKNEAKKIESKLIERAYQGIEGCFYDQFMPLMFCDEDKKKYALLVKKIQSISPYDIYEIASKQEDTHVVLNGYVVSLCKNCGIEFNHLREDVRNNIHTIMNQTALLIAQLQNPPKTALGIELQQEQKSKSQIKSDMELNQQMQQEQRMKTRQDQSAVFQYGMEQYLRKFDRFDAIFSGNGFYRPIRLPETDHIKQPLLLFSSQHFEKFEQANRFYFKELKPIKAILIKIMPDKTVQAVACTAAGMNYYSLLMNEMLLTKKDPSYALIDVESGDVLQKTSNTSDKEVSSIDCSETLVYANFLNGNVSDPQALSQVIKKYGWTQKNYELMAEKVKQVHVSNSPVKLLAHKALEILCGWRSLSTLNDAKISGRYQPPKQESILTESLKLNSLQSQSESKIENTHFPIASKDTALEGYLFGKNPDPVNQSADEFVLYDLYDQFKAEMSKYTANDEGMSALLHLKMRVENVMKSIAPFKERIEAIKQIQSDYELLTNDINYFVRLKADIHKCNVEKPVEKYKALSFECINQYYLDYKNQIPLGDCKQFLKERLSLLSKEISQIYKESFLPNKFQGSFWVVPFESDLAKFLNNAVENINQIQGPVEKNLFRSKKSS